MMHLKMWRKEFIQKWQNWLTPNLNLADNWKKNNERPSAVSKKSMADRKSQKASVVVYKQDPTSCSEKAAIAELQAEYLIVRVTQL